MGGVGDSLFIQGWVISLLQSSASLNTSASHPGLIIPSGQNLGFFSETQQKATWCSFLIAEGAGVPCVFEGGTV